ncbi:unnamed protein product, partial [Mesorhabditis spiculigera]
MASPEEVEAQKQKLLVNQENPNTLEFYNARSRVYHDDEEEKIINWQRLKELKDQKKWGVIRHPMVLNYVNERLMDMSGWYTFHIIAYFSFLLLLSWHVFSRSFYKDLLITAYLAFFVFMVFVKTAMKVQISTGVSKWSAVALFFNFLTYLVTFAYVWLPTLFRYDDYHPEVKHVVLWFLPIVAIISAWVNFLYILRQSPYGIYIFMMVRILRSFGHIATIWIPTLIAFSFAFHLIMRDSGIEPWISVERDTNSTMVQKLFVVLQAITKTSTMIIGEVDANDILGTRQWIPSILVLAFEIITVILLMNLMVSLAVGDVSDLRNSDQDKLLKIKVSSVIEALQFSQVLPQTLPDSCKVDRRPASELNDHKYRLEFTNPRMRVRIRRELLAGRHQMVHLEDCQIVFKEATDSGIPNWQPEADEAKPSHDSRDGWQRRYAKWLIGLDWTGYLDL